MKTMPPGQLAERNNHHNKFHIYEYLRLLCVSVAGGESRKTLTQFSKRENVKKRIHIIASVRLRPSLFQEKSIRRLVCCNPKSL